MNAKSRLASRPADTVRRIALGYPETIESVVCDKAAFKARNKAFVFLGSGDATYSVMLKLRGSLAEARQLAKEDPDCCHVGGHDWVTLTYSHTQSPPGDLLERWIDESFRLLAPKQLVASLDGDRPLAAAGNKNSTRSK